MLSDVKGVVAGLGGIGLAMALRLADCGMEVIGLDPDIERRRIWSDNTGKRAYEFPGQIEDWDEIDRLVVAVRTASQVEAVLRETKNHSRRDLAVYIVTTVKPSFWNDLSNFSEPSWHIVECPVSGGERLARSGAITVFIANYTNSDRELIESVGGSVIDLGSKGLPSLMKLINNSLAAMNAANVARCLLFAQQEGIKGSLFLEALEEGSGRSVMSSSIGKMSSKQFDLLEKDVGLLIDDRPEAPVSGVDGLSRLVLEALGDYADPDAVL